MKIELISQKTKDAEVQKIRDANTERRANEKAQKKRVSTVDRKIQKDIFRAHREILEKLWVVGRGMMFAKHFANILGLNQAKMYRELRVLQQAGLINIVKFYHQNVLQLTQFSVNQFQKKKRMVALTNANIIKHSFLGEILEKKVKQARLNDKSSDFETIFRKVSEQTNFCRTPKKENLDVWKVFDKFQKRDTYCQLSGSKLSVYILDAYNADVRRIIERFVEIHNLLDDAKILGKYSVKFFICVADEGRLKYLTMKHSQKAFREYLEKRQLVQVMPLIQILSCDLTNRVFAHVRIVP